MEGVFIQTSPDSYDRHIYQVILREGDPVRFDNYEDAQNFWYATVGDGNLLTIEVLDRPQKRTKAKGF